MITSSIVSVIGRSGRVGRRDFPRNEECGSWRLLREPAHLVGRLESERQLERTAGVGRVEDQVIGMLLRSPFHEGVHEGSGDSLTAPLGWSIYIHHQRYWVSHHSSAIVGDAR